MKKYIIPRIKTRQIYNEQLLAALSKNEETGDEGQFSKENKNSSWSSQANAWDGFSEKEE